MTELGRQRLKLLATELNKLLSEDYPDFLVSLTLSQLHFSAIAYIGKPYLTELNRRLISDAKQRVGLCHTEGCNNAIATSLTHPPDCELCDAQISAECDRIDELLDGNDEP